MIQLLIAGMQRTEYLDQTRAALEAFHPDLYDSRHEFHDTGGLGMAAAVQLAWKQLLTFPDWDYVWHVEEDMLPLRPVPVENAARILDSNTWLAQMLFQREPWWGSQPEMDTGSVYGGIQQSAAHFHQGRGYASHDHIFSLNPCLIPRRVVEAGWPSGPLGVGNESGKTAACLEAGYLFGLWGNAKTPPFFRHIGHGRAEGWKL